ncbi:GlxA family transcriptional regulator [Chitinibacteraceae bacterium HSL-7]
MTRVVVFLLYDGVNVLDVSGPLEVFSQPVRNGFAEETEPYRCILASATGGRIHTSAGAVFETVALGSLDEIDTLIVPGGGTQEPALWPLLRERAEAVRRCASVCTAALILARAGLLAGRRATTHWAYVDALRQVDASVRVEGDALYVQDGKIWTAAGISSGIDLALALVADDLGHAVAMRVARQMVVFLHRPCRQSQFSAPLAAQSRDARFAELHAWMSAHLDQDLSVERLADRMAMSPRTFARHYRSANGVTPARAVKALRLEAASRALAEPEASIKRVARYCGFGDEQGMRRAFVEHYGVTPVEWRARFSGVAAAR